MIPQPRQKAKAPQHASPLDVPYFDRLNYFYGQGLGAHDFRTEQDFFREKLKLHNRCLHGYGTVCGLQVVQDKPADDCDREADPKKPSRKAEIEQAREKLEAARRDFIDARWVVALQARLDELLRQEAEVGPAAEEEQEEAPPQQQPKEPRSQTPPPIARLWILPGVALDCQGNELVVRCPFSVNLWDALSRKDRRVLQGKKEGEKSTLYVSLCYREHPIDPTRPLLADACGAASPCTYGKLRDACCVKVSLEKPEEPACDPCCDRCQDPCLLLAEIHGYEPRAKKLDIRNEVRRCVATYAPTTITGISWTHGANYTPEEAGEILGTDDETSGLVLHFSRNVLAATLTRGVVDLWLLEGGKGRHGNIYHIDGELVPRPDPAKQPLVNSIRYRDVSGECYNPGDRILIMVRGAFILDECCHPLDGTHVGGRVPIILPKFKKFDRPAPPGKCASTPYGPWTSGTGHPGGTFESWFWITEPDRKPGQKDK
jgi:hypothetical protein